jgi:hypothetical protein
VALGRAMAKVARCEQALAEARAALAALDAKPVAIEEPHRFATYGSVEELHAAQGGAVPNPGINVAETVRAIHRKIAGEPS